MIGVGMMIIILGMGIVVEVGEGRAAVVHEVGGDRFGWRLNVNFSDWAAHQIFFVGDWLYFGFDKQKMSVLEVNQTGYKNCTESNYITNITRGGRDVFNLTAARPYYFISGRGYCNRGVKLSINVLDAPLDSTPPSSSSDTRSPTTLSTTTTIITSHASSIFSQPLDLYIIMFIISINIAYL
ncbi:Lamin-like protein, partial [Bienertia sinuspersici]